MKSLKNLLIPLVVLVLLVIATIVYFVVPKKETVSTTGAISNESVNVLNIANTDIQRFAMIKKNGEDLAFTSEIDSESNEQIWSVEGNDMELSQSTVSSYISILSSYVANSTITTPEDLANYSLAEPDFTIEITKFDSSVVKVFIGSYTYDSTGVYFMLENDSNVYITAKLKRDYCEYSVDDFAATTVLDLDFAEVSQVEFIRTSDSVDIVTVPVAVDGSFDYPSFNVVEPFTCPTNNNYESLVRFIAELQVSNYEDISPDDLASFGLDEPAYKFIFTMDDGSEITVSLSSNMSGKYYGSCSEINRYFSLNEFQFNGVDTPLMSLLDSYIAMYDAKDVSSISGTYGDATFSLELNIHESFSEDNGQATLNSRNAYVRIIEGGRSYGAILFESIVGMQYSGIDTNANPTLDSALSYKIITKDYSIINIDFVQRDDGSYYVFIDGEYTGFYVVSSVLFAHGGNDPYAYGSWAAYELTVEAIDNSVNGVYPLPAESSGVSE